jgi:hypothetical protein
MKKIITLTVTVLVIALALASCDRPADVVSYNVSEQADNFKVTRRLSVLNVRTDKPMFELIGAFSIKTDAADGQLEITCKTAEDTYKKHFVGLNQWVTYVVEDLEGVEASKYKYTVRFFPDAIIPFEVKGEE